ncbi:MAG: hypothetical protein AAF721_05780 [Myxococcota bacterium]
MSGSPAFLLATCAAISSCTAPPASDGAGAGPEAPTAKQPVAEAKVAPAAPAPETPAAPAAPPAPAPLAASDDEPAETPTAEDPPAAPTFTRALAGEDAQVFTMADGGVILTAGPQLYVVAPDHTIESDPKLLAGLPSPFDAEKDGSPTMWFWGLQVNGRWPDGAFVSYYVAPAPRVDTPPRPTFRWRDDRWDLVERAGPGVSSYYADARPWIDGSVLSLRRFQLGFPDALFITDWEDASEKLTRKHEAYVKKLRAKIAKTKQLVVTRGLPKGPDLEAMLGAMPPALAAFDSLSTGEIFASTAEDRARILIVSPAGSATLTEPTVTPADGLRLRMIRALAPDRVLAAGGAVHGGDDRPVLLAYDGATWTSEDAPACDEYRELHAIEELPNGDQVALCAATYSENELLAEAGGLWFRQPGHAWTKLPHAARGLAIHGDTIWISVEDGVWTTAEVARPLEALDREARDIKILADGPKPLGMQRRLY